MCISNRSLSFISRMLQPVNRRASAGSERVKRLTIECRGSLVIFVSSVSIASAGPSRYCRNIDPSNQR